MIENITEHFLLFQANGHENGFHWPGTSHVNPGSRMEFGSVEKAVKGLLVFLAQTLPKWFPPFTFGF